jgi:hypothetical protein
MTDGLDETLVLAVSIDFLLRRTTRVSTALGRRSEKKKKRKKRFKIREKDYKAKWSSPEASQFFFSRC